MICKCDALSFPLAAAFAGAATGVTIHHNARRNRS
jgi:hypothetical protein